MKIHSDEMLKRQQIRATFVRDFFKLMPDKILENNLDKVVEITRTVIEPTFDYIEGLAADKKVRRVRLIDEGGFTFDDDDDSNDSSDNNDDDDGAVLVETPHVDC